VTGASGGVGGTAVAILGQRGYEVWAATGKEDEIPRLRELGAAGFLTRDEVTVEGKPLESARWAGAVDAVGAATIPYVLRTLRPGATVAASGNASGPKLDATVLPFILRGVAMLGMDSVLVPIARLQKSRHTLDQQCEVGNSSFPIVASPAILKPAVVHATHLCMVAGRLMKVAIIGRRVPHHPFLQGTFRLYSHVHRLCMRSRTVFFPLPFTIIPLGFCCASVLAP